MNPFKNKLLPAVKSGGFKMEDPFLWYEDGLFRLVIKDDFKDNSGGLTGEWGAGLYATSKDCKAYTYFLCYRRRPSAIQLRA